MSSTENTGLEFRVCWRLEAVAIAHSATDWQAWEDEHATHDEINAALTADHSTGPLAEGFEQALENSGFGWWVETRPAGSTDEGGKGSR